MKQHQVAARYAKALFAIAKERRQTGLIGCELRALVTMYEGSPDLREFFARPSLPPAAKRAAATEIGRRSGLAKLAVDFLALVVERGRANHVGVIAETYEKLLDIELGRARAHVRSAVPLTAGEQERLVATLGKMLPADQVVLDEIVDPGLLSGFVVETGSVVLDGSLRGQLNTMRRRLADGTR